MAKSTVSINKILDEVTIPIRGDIQAQYIAKRSRFFEHSKIDSATINAQTIKEFEAKWNQVEMRMEIVPGKEVLRRVREICQNKFAVNLTENRIIDEISRNEIPPSLMELIGKLEAYRKNERSIERVEET